MSMDEQLSGPGGSMANVAINDVLQLLIEDRMMKWDD